MPRRSTTNTVPQSAVANGEEIIETERRLNAQFAAGPVNPDSLAAALTESGVLRGRHRYVRLEAHPKQRDLLTQEQTRAYD